MDKLPDRAEGRSCRSRSRTASCEAAGNHDGAGTEVFLLVDALFVNLGTVESNRNEGITGTGDDLVLLQRLCECGERAKAQEHQKDASQDDEQTNQNA